MNSDRESEARDMFRAKAVELFEFEDNYSPARLASAQRLRAAGLVRRNDLPRFSWSLDTDGRFKTETFDLFTHVSWLLQQLKPSASIEKARSRGVEIFLSLFYVGNGTGGGPYISQQVAETLVRYGIPMQVGFYYEDAEAA